MIVICPSCGVKNRGSEEKLNANPQCGQCYIVLIRLAPIELNEQHFKDYVSHSDLPILINL